VGKLNYAVISRHNLYIFLLMHIFVSFVSILKYFTDIFILILQFGILFTGVSSERAETQSSVLRERWGLWNNY